jgi:hypothetical protein
VLVEQQVKSTHRTLPKIGSISSTEFYTFDQNDVAHVQSSRAVGHARITRATLTIFTVAFEMIMKLNTKFLIDHTKLLAHKSVYMLNIEFTKLSILPTSTKGFFNTIRMTMLKAESLRA